MDISVEDRNAIQISELTSAINNIQATQNKILNSLENEKKITPVIYTEGNTDAECLRKIIDSLSNRNNIKVDLKNSFRG